MFNKKHFQELVYDYSSHERKTNNVLKHDSNSVINYSESTWIRIMNEWFYDLCSDERFNNNIFYL